MKAIAFVTRVHPKRPNMLKECIKSVKRQTSDDYVHILHKDDNTANSYGVSSANNSLIRLNSINARYVMILDDDDMLIDPNFVKIFSKVVKKDVLEIVFFKGMIKDKGIFPRPEVWKKAPIFASIASFCFAVRRDIWMDNIYEFGKPTLAGLGGDFSFISLCDKNTKNHLWLDRIVAKTQKKEGYGRGEHEHA